MPILTPSLISPIPLDDPFPHMALLGHTINPDTGLIAEYKELSMSSNGHHWQKSLTGEIFNLAQGPNPQMPTGTNTLLLLLLWF